EEDLRERQSVRARRRFRGIPRLALQRPPIEHRAATPPESGRSDAGDHGKAPRRGVGDYPRLTLQSRTLSGSSSAVERELPKLDVAGSIPVSRSIQMIRVPVVVIAILAAGCSQPGP